MAHVVNQVNVPLQGRQPVEGRAVRLARSNSEADRSFHVLVTEDPPAREPAPASGWAGLVTAGKSWLGESPVKATPAPQPSEAPSARSVFGESPWIASPAGQGPLGLYYYNPVYFATEATARKVAEMVGGAVIQRNEFCVPGSPFQQQQPNYMVELPNGRVINPGLVATLFTHGYPQPEIDRLLAIEAA